MIVPVWGLLPACNGIAPEKTTPASKNAFFIGAPQSVIWLRDFSLSSQCKLIGSLDGDAGVNRNDKTWAHQNVAPGFAPVCGDSPRFLRGEPGIPQRRRCVTIVGQASRPDSQSDEACKGWVSRAPPLPSFRAERPGFFLARVVCAPGRVGRNLSFLHLRTAAPSPRAFCGMNLSPSSVAASSSRHLRIRSNLTKVRSTLSAARPEHHLSVAPGFAPLCGDSPRFLRGEPGISQKPHPFEKRNPKGRATQFKSLSHPNI